MAKTNKNWHPTGGFKLITPLIKDFDEIGDKPIFEGRARASSYLTSIWNYLLNVTEGKTKKLQTVVGELFLENNLMTIMTLHSKTFSQTN